MKWYTLENGRLCLGTNEKKFANFHIATDVKLNGEFSAPLMEAHIELIGSYPEDWFEDETIDLKINNTARHFFSHNEITPHHA